MNGLKFSVFGRQVLVVESNNGWSTFYLGAEGKRRPATDILVPQDILESDLKGYLADLCHEWASERFPDVTALD